jgi:hypothetical protein
MTSDTLLLDVKRAVAGCRAHFKVARGSRINDHDMHLCYDLVRVAAPMTGPLSMAAATAGTIHGTEEHIDRVKAWRRTTRERAQAILPIVKRAGFVAWIDASLDVIVKTRSKRKVNA